MFERFDRVLEVGYGHSSATRLVQQTVNKVVVTDFDQIFISDIESRQQPEWRLDARVHDMISGPLQENFDGIFSLDVLEHVEKTNEDTFLKNVCIS
jgi:cyclopropane fatty-acyl-phospholipid synthase-like methyltransferase